MKTISITITRVSFLVYVLLSVASRAAVAAFVPKTTDFSRPRRVEVWGSTNKRADCRLSNHDRGKGFKAVASQLLMDSATVQKVGGGATILDKPTVVETTRERVLDEERRRTQSTQGVLFKLL